MVACSHNRFPVSVDKISRVAITFILFLIHRKKKWHKITTQWPQNHEIWFYQQKISFFVLFFLVDWLGVTGLFCFTQKLIIHKWLNFPLCFFFVVQLNCMTFLLLNWLSTICIYIFFLINCVHTQKHQISFDKFTDFVFKSVCVFLFFWMKMNNFPIFIVQLFLKKRNVYW